MTSNARLSINPVACDGRGLCAEVAPELITLDDWGFPILLANGIVPPKWEVHAREAVRLCPKLALRLDVPPTSRRTGGVRRDREKALVLLGVVQLEDRVQSV